MMLFLQLLLVSIHPLVCWFLDLFLSHCFAEPVLCAQTSEGENGAVPPPQSGQGAMLRDSQGSECWGRGE